MSVPSSGLHHLKSSIKTLNCVCPQARCFDGLAMDAATTASGPQASPGKSSFDQKVETRAEWHEQLRGRNNVTSCRSPTRESETLRIKTELKEKRHLDFLRRRSVSPEAPGVARCRNCSSKLKFSPRRRRNSKAGFPDSCTSNGRPVTMSTQANASNGQRSDRWASWWSENITVMNHKKSTSKQKTVKVLKTSVRTSQRAEKIWLNFPIQAANVLPKKILQDNSSQTEPGVLTVEEAEVQQLAEFLKEALWREEALNRKLTALQESTSNLMNSSKSMWTARCSEDLLRNKIKALEAQLQLCLQKVPKDGLKKLMIQMEKQKLVYEEAAIAALQRAMQDKAEADSRAATLEEILTATAAEAERWRSLYEELEQKSGQLRKNQNLKVDQLQQLQSQVELSRTRETRLREEVELLRQQGQELQYDAALLEEDNQVLREEIQQLRDDTSESQSFMKQKEEEEPHPPPSPLVLSRDPQVEEQLHHMQEKLRLKDAECEELQSELQSSQARLSQCREELRQLSHRHRRPTPCGRWWKICLFFLLVAALVEVAMLWLWYPPFREQVEDFWSDVELRLENYLRQMASSRHAGCFRPI